VVIIGWVSSDLERTARARRFLVIVVAAVFVAAGLVATPPLLQQTARDLVPAAAAQPCPPVEVIFARGRFEPPGPGAIGDAFVTKLRNRTGKNIGLYSVRYPANTEVDLGANDMSSHIQYMMSSCPDTRLVLGGYSLGAAVTDVVLAVPFTAFGFKNPLPAAADRHIAAVALFGNGIAWVGQLGQFNPVYAGRTIDLCHGADPICVPTDPENWASFWGDHLAPAYINSGMVDQAVDFVAARI